MDNTFQYYEVELMQVVYSEVEDIFFFPTSDTIRVNMTHSTLDTLRSQVMKPIPNKPKVYFAEGGGMVDIGYFVKKIIRGYHSRFELEKHSKDSNEYLEMFNGVTIKNIFNMSPPAFIRCFSMESEMSRLNSLALDSIKAYEDFYSVSPTKPSSYDVICPPMDITIKIGGNDFTFDFRSMERVLFIDGKYIVGFKDSTVEFNGIEEEDAYRVTLAFARYGGYIGGVSVTKEPKFTRVIEGKTLCFTGHRPDKLNGYNSEDNLDLINALYFKIETAIKDGVETFISGMALGVDMWSAETVLKLRKEYPHIKLVCAIPCKNHSAKWGQESKKQWQSIVDKANEVIYVSEEPYTNWCMQDRNKFMVDNSDIVLAVWDGTPGGTSNCVTYAMSQKKNIDRINPKDL